MKSITRMARDVGCIVLFSLIPIHSANSAFIPLLGGLIVYNESVTLRDGGGAVVFETGTSTFLAESIQVTSGGAFGSASNTAGFGQTPALTQASANTNELGGIASADADITFNARLIKLHPDAPDDIGIPLLFTSSLSATEFGVAELVIGAGATLVQEQVSGGSIDIDSSLSVLANDFLTTRVSASSQADYLLFNSTSASASTPVFAIDPNFTVEFLGRTERAVDLYTLAVTPEIGFAGNFQTVTPFTDGCLPDPSILTTSGTPSVIDGSTVTCQAIDPSGFRSYGNDPGDPSGILNGLDVVVTAGATVETGADDTETFGILGQDNALLNRGTVRAAGENSEAIFLGGDGNEVANEGAIRTSGDTSTAVFLEGDFVSVLNEGVITTDGFQSSAVVLEGDDALVLNEGEIQTSADQSAGLVIEGNNGTIDNSGTIATQGVFATGMVMLGIGSDSIENSGTITTTGEHAIGILALGTEHTIANLDTGAGNWIWTTGTRAHGIALGLQEAVLPPGVIIPPEVLDPVSGTVFNAGGIETQGSDADGIHVFSNAATVINTGPVITSGLSAHAISVLGNDAVVTNDNGTVPGSLVTSGQGGAGIEVTGTRAEVGNAGTIETGGQNAAGISVQGADARVQNIAGTITTSNTEAIGIDVLGSGAQVFNDAAGRIQTSNNAAHGIQVRASGTAAVAQNLANSEISTEGLGAFGIRALTNSGNVTNDGLIHTTGVNAYGIRLLGDDNQIHNQSAGEIITESNGASALSIVGNANTVTNAHMILTGGTMAHGIEVTGDGNTVTNSGLIETIPDSFSITLQDTSADARGNEVVNDIDAFIRYGSVFASGDRATLLNRGTFEQATVYFDLESRGEVTNTEEGVIGKDAGQAVFIQSLNEAVFTNLGSISIVEEGQGVLLGGNEEATFSNRGAITVGSATTPADTLNHGVTVTAASETGQVTVLNGELPTDTAAIEVTSTSGLAFQVLAVAGGNASVRNEGSLTANGGGGIGLAYEPLIALPVFNIINAGEITTTGSNSRGITAEGGITGMELLSAETGSDGSYAIPDQRVVANEDSIDMAGDDSIGMSFINVNSTRIENAGNTTVAGDRTQGILLGALSDSNFLFNAGPLEVSGTNSRGVVVSSSNNLLINGQDTVTIPEGDIFSMDGAYPADPVVIYSGLVEFSTPGGTTVPVGEITATGANAIGVQITGNDNLVINTLGLRDNNDAALIEAGSQLTGTAYGITLTGNGNTVYNAGTIAGGTTGILGGSSEDTVYNTNRISGGVLLGGGNDTLFVQTGHTINGIADGGAGSDSLLVNAIAAAPGEPDPGPITLSGNDYSSFEHMQKGGAGIARLEDSWTSLVTSYIKAGTLELMPGSVASGLVVVRAGARIQGNGTVAGLLLDHNAVAGAGTSTGTLTITEDLVVDGGILEFEANSLIDTDKILVGGDAWLNTGFVDVILDFTPAPEDLLEFLVLQGTLNIAEGFGGIRGFAAANSGVALGTEFLVDLGGQIFQGTVTSTVPIPPSVLLFGSGLLGLVAIARRRKTA